MALRDQWNRFLVFFGLAEEYYDEEDTQGHLEPVDEGRDAPDQERERDRGERERSNVRRLSSRRRERDEIDDIFADDSAGSGGRTGVLRSVDNGRSSRPGSPMKVHLVSPRSFNDAQEIADQFKRSVPVILNLQGADRDLSKRLIDFASGLTYALEGGMQRVAEKTFLLTPRNVEVSAEERARLLEKGFFNQS